MSERNNANAGGDKAINLVSPMSFIENDGLSLVSPCVTIDDYDKRAFALAIYPGIGHNLTYPTLKLCGEAGEVAEKLGKVFRDSAGVIDNETRVLMLKELGDVLWYINACAHELGSNLNEVAVMNLHKLESRAKRGVLGGSGDNR